MATKTVAVPQTNAVIAKERAMERVRQAITEMTVPDQSAEEIALSIIEATSIDQILGSTVLHLQDMVGTPFLLVSAKLTASDYQDGLGAYTVMNVILADGSPAVITTGSTNVVSQVIAMHGGDYFPQWVVASEATAASGFKVYRLNKGPGEAPTQSQLTDRF